uniref:RDD domain-containing protein n=1 Tax=Ciona savignyi TaxID=51511 RepID=H2YG18_CIOSA
MAPQMSDAKVVMEPTDVHEEHPHAIHLLEWKSPNSCWKQHFADPNTRCHPSARLQDPIIVPETFAETIDFLILLTFKLLFLWMLMTFMGINAFQISFQLMLVDEINFDQIDDVYSDELQTMLIVALIYRTMCCLYEFIFVWLRGATPGKSLMGLKVIALNSRTQLAPQHGAVIMAGGNLSASNAWTRSFVKNLSIAFMIPTFITALFYSYKRTSYDIIAGTIV